MRISISLLHIPSFHSRPFRRKQGVTAWKFGARLALKFSTCGFRERTEHVAVGGSGSVTLRVLQPVNSSASNSRVLVYLPPGPIFKSPQQRTPYIFDVNAQADVDSALRLCSARPCTTVIINYRLGRDISSRDNSSFFKFPTPIHDTLAGFDWIFKNLCPSKVCVFGKHIGGSLALMLPLTEPRSIAAVASQDPICDWVGLDDYCIIGSADKKDFDTGDARDDGEHKKRGRKKKPTRPVPTDLVHLLQARNELFYKPQHFHDSFASPALFLRTSGKYCPTDFPALLAGPGHPTPIIQPAKEVNFWVLTAAMLEEADTEGGDPGFSTHNVRRRKVLSRWPPVGIDRESHWQGVGHSGEASDPMVLPHIRIFTESHSLSAEENVEDQDADHRTTTVDALASRLAASTLGSRSPSHPSPNDRDLPPSEPNDRRATTRGSLPKIAKIEEDTVLGAQAIEMIHLLRSACFWGRERGLAEQKVQLTRLPAATPPPNVEFMDNTTEKTSLGMTHVGDHDLHVPLRDYSLVNEGSTEQAPNTSVEEQAGEWLHMISDKVEGCSE
ncbi:hypothetical protein LOZ53_004559 [Ophidiomyces ophidiicola]|nr:hypothetical protein LOZ55_002929 [Ophidiomyces ophidiicola]KAI1986837.1 hypothetical protein LOZ53_004559 [Ophidiomyces ophidiicola]KAI1988481.1 hypothetical protein LOZ54_003163 [Ophidiomyces ophidiicola]KAI1991049.1 hypothetical protein LOZ51_004579 [Ophidiomyces ophidiicola]